MTISAQVEYRQVSRDSAETVTNAIASPDVGLVPVGISIPQGVADTVSIEGRDHGGTWHFLQDAGAVYYATADSSVNMGIAFKPTVMSNAYEQYRFTLNVAASDDESFWVTFGQLFTGR